MTVLGGYHYTIHDEIVDSPYLTYNCAQCGMGLTGPDEFHPFEACVIFARTRSARDVVAAMPRLLAAHGVVVVAPREPLPRAQVSQSRKGAHDD